jgi:hypothetical protein
LLRENVVDDENRFFLSAHAVNENHTCTTPETRRRLPAEELCGVTDFFFFCIATTIHTIPKESLTRAFVTVLLVGGGMF